MSAIIKLYDKNISAFKLNEQISFIGVLEFNHVSQSKDTSQIPQLQSADLDPNSMIDGFLSGIPNENSVPHLHAITSRKMAVLQNPDLLKYAQVDKASLNNMFSADQMVTS